MILALLYSGFFIVVMVRLPWLMTLVDALLRLLGRFHLLEAVRLRRWHFGLRGVPLTLRAVLGREPRHA
ncbi:MAG: hypothetical protein RI601_07345 [Desulfurivibrionaceae bacterium]|nr:hypothetical protein [Desulfurivibrionaceae bacterium]